jgi:hypothetical protein
LKDPNFTIEHYTDVPFGANTVEVPVFDPETDAAIRAVMEDAKKIITELDKPRYPTQQITRAAAAVIAVQVIKEVARRLGRTYSYVVYEKLNPLTNKVYAGRTFGVGPPLAVLAVRDAAHRLDPEKLGFNGALLSAYTWVSDPFSWRGYCSSRGREQDLITYYGGPAAGRSHNKIRGVSATNLDALTFYFTAAHAYPVLPFVFAYWDPIYSLAQVENAEVAQDRGEIISEHGSPPTY